MKSYEILEHTADLRIRFSGKTLKTLFVNALAGMMDYLKEPEGAGSEIPRLDSLTPREVKISSPDLNALLVDFLSEALTLADTNQEIYREAEFLDFPSGENIEAGKPLELKARLFGKRVGRFDRDIKAVTYHGLDIKQNKEGFWEAKVLFDI